MSSYPNSIILSNIYGLVGAAVIIVMMLVAIPVFVHLETPLLAESQGITDTTFGPTAFASFMVDNYMILEYGFATLLVLDLLYFVVYPFVKQYYQPSGYYN